MKERKNKQADTGISDYRNFPDNLRVLRMFLGYNSAADFARAIKLKDTKRLAEVEKGRLKPTKKEIETIVKQSGYSLGQLLCRKFSLRIVIK